MNQPSDSKPTRSRRFSIIGVILIAWVAVVSIAVVVWLRYAAKGEEIGKLPWRKQTGDDQCFHRESADGAYRVSAKGIEVPRFMAKPATACTEGLGELELRDRKGTLLGQRAKVELREVEIEFRVSERRVLASYKGYRSHGNFCWYLPDEAAQDHSQDALNRDLRCAASGGQSQFIAKLAAAGATINAADDDGKTALIHAVASDDAPTVAEVLKLRPDLAAKDREGTPALQFVRPVIPHNELAPHPVLGLLLAAGADPNIRDKNGYTLLHQANVTAGQVRQLLEAGADADARTKWRGSTLVARAGGEHSVALLLAKGATLETDEKSVLEAVRAATEEGNGLLLQQLERQGVDLSKHLAAADWNKLLHFAAEEARPALAEIALAHGADAAGRDNTGATALETAKQHLEVMKVVCQADPTQGEECRLYRDHARVVEVLERQGAGK